MTRLGVAAMVLLICAAGCARAGSPEPSGSVSGSGVRGVAVVDAGCPVLENTSTCPRAPLRARIVVVRQGSAERVGVVETGADGAFELALLPDAYVLQGENLTGAAYPTAMPMPMLVRAGEFTHVMVVFDSGVRGPAT